MIIVNFFLLNRKAFAQNKKINKQNNLILNVDKIPVDREIYELLLIFKSSISTRRVNRFHTKALTSNSDDQSDPSKDFLTKALNIRKLLLDFVRQIWNNYEILKFFNVQEPIGTTSLSDTPFAYTYMTKSLGKVVYSMIGFSDSETCSVITNTGKEDITFSLPSENGLLFIYKIVL